MRRVVIRSMLFAVLAAGVPAAILVAQTPNARPTVKPNVKLGLWETVMTMEGQAPGQPQKLCLTADRLATGSFDPTPDAECKHTVTSSTASSMDVTETCANSKEPSMTGTGQLHIQVVTTESVKGTLATKMSMGGRSMTLNGTFTSKFLQTDCGNVK